MGIRVLEVNVDDYLHGGVYALVTDIIRKLPEDITADIAALEPFQNPEHVKMLKSYHSDVYYVGSKGNKLLKQYHIYKNVKKLIKKEGYDVVHLHSDVAHKILVSGLAAKSCGVKKIIFHSHANDADGGHIEIRRKFHKLCAGILKKIPSVHLATSADAAAWMYGKDDKNSVVLRNGIEYKRFRFDPEMRERIRKELGAERKILLGFVGRFVDQKNPFYLIKIIESFLKKENYAMLCIGQGALQEEFKTILKEKKIIDKVCFINETDEIENYYQAMDIMLMPSNFEGFGLAAVEAQVSGTPVLASVNVPDLTRISNLIEYYPIEENSVGQWQDAICQWQDYQKKDVSGDIDYVYDLQKMVDTLVDLYRTK